MFPLREGDLRLPGGIAKHHFGVLRVRSTFHTTFPVPPPWVLVPHLTMGIRTTDICTGAIACPSAVLREVRAARGP